jgi:hypothetical protein
MHWGPSARGAPSRSHANPFVHQGVPVVQGRGEVVEQQQREVSRPIAASLLRRLREAWRETELLHNGKLVPHVGVFEDFAVTNGVDVDRHPLDAIARAGTSEELPAMRTTEAIDEYDLVAFRDNVEHLASRVGDRLIEHLVELSPSCPCRKLTL